MSVSTRSPHKSHENGQKRQPLGELPLSNFIYASNVSPHKTASFSSATGVSPILKPAKARGSPARIKFLRDVSVTAPKAQPHTPPHRTTPKNIRPHHSHVTDGPLVAPSIQSSPSTAVAKHQKPNSGDTNEARHARLSTPPLLSRHDHVSSASPRELCSNTSSAGSGATEVSTLLQSLPRKRERVDDVTELGRAKERVQQPIVSSPSPRKHTLYSIVGQHNHGHHRRSSSSTSSVMLSPASALRKSKQALPAAIGQVGHVDDENEDDGSSSGSEEEIGEQFEIKPLRISASPSSSSSKDLFGADTTDESGGLLVFRDRDAVCTRGEASSPPAFVIEDEDKENSEDRFHEQVAKLGKHKLEVDRVSSKSFTSMLSPGNPHSSPGKILLSPTSASNAGSSQSSTPQALKRKKGTGGRLSLLASGDDL